MKEFDSTPRPALQFIRDQYGKTIFSMIHHCVKDEEAAAEIFEKVIFQLGEERCVAQFSFFKVMSFARTMTREYILQHRSLFEGHPYLQDPPVVDNNYILQLICLGRYSITQLCKILGMEELTLRKRIRAAVEELKGNSKRRAMVASLN